MGEQYIRKPNTKCVICNKDIYRRPVEINNSKGRVFCSSTCYGISCRKEAPCLICGKLILASKHKITCSRGCANKHRAGIKYKLNRPKDKVKSQRSIKLKLLRERNKCCERCGYSKVQILHVHHKDGNRENNDMINLELICPNCHFEEHYLENSWIDDIDIW